MSIVNVGSKKDASAFLLQAQSKERKIFMYSDQFYELTHFKLENFLDEQGNFILHAFLRRDLYPGGSYKTSDFIKTKHGPQALRLIKLLL
ncbi:MAG: hypothetical protein Q8858_12270 [Bacteroidota bacterium]|nr:hypothetical protein [Bacteroidota bacterium]MDP4196898.1 hypothetical protein [Bacteroidota bacterium]